MVATSEATTSSKSPYEMRVDFAIVEHLGINLYSNLAAVLTETVANAWDADASNVEINFNKDRNEIEIIDDGIGMTINDMNNQYLLVGYKRRQDSRYGQVTQKGRAVMGRKGLGKLSLFSIANIVEIQSTKSGEKHGLRISVEDIEDAARKGKQNYFPMPLTQNLDIEIGTKILLKDIKRERWRPSSLRKRLARRFSIIGPMHDFQIYIDGSPISIEDRGDLPKVQFLWTLGESNIDDKSLHNVKETMELNSYPENWNPEWKISGWLGTAKKPRELNDAEAGNLNTIVVLARGRLFHENILDKVNDGRLYTKYLTGQIEAEFLDTDDEDDIATSDRQRIKEDDPRYIALIDFLCVQLDTVDRYWNQWRNKHSMKKALETQPVIQEWLEMLEDNHRKNAEQLIEKLSVLKLENEEDRSLLYRHGIIAFERIRIRNLSPDFIQGIDRVDKLLALLADRDSLEAALYRDIVKSRLDTIKHFMKLVNDNEREKVLQQRLFKDLWLLDPTWEHATDSETELQLIESTLKEVGNFPDDMSEKEKYSRVDIAYRTNANKHVLIELKRAGRTVTLDDLYIQGNSYVRKLKKILQNNGHSSPDIEVIFVIGKRLTEEDTDPRKVKDTMNAISPGSRIVHYSSLIKGALAAYREYIKQSEKFDRIDKIIMQLK